MNTRSIPGRFVEMIAHNIDMDAARIRSRYVAYNRTALYVFVEQLEREFPHVRKSLIQKIVKRNWSLLVREMRRAGMTIVGAPVDARNVFRLDFGRRRKTINTDQFPHDLF